MESLGQISKSPTRRNQFKSLPQMEDSELLTSEPTPGENYKKKLIFFFDIYRTIYNKKHRHFKFPNQLNLKFSGKRLQS